jgi:hypothetical protein
MPNFHSVSAGSQLPPQSAKAKLLNATQDSFDYSSFMFVGALAGIAQAQRSTREFGQGSAGYGRYYWHSQTFKEFWPDVSRKFFKGK